MIMSLAVHVRLNAIENPRMITMSRFSPWWLWCWKFTAKHQLYRLRARLERSPSFETVADQHYSASMTSGRWELRSEPQSPPSTSTYDC